LIERSVLGHFTLIPLGPKGYRDAVKLAVAQNFGSGAIYDALQLIGARRGGCTTPYTLNLRHFLALAPADPLIQRHKTMAQP
jgi:hypothetical protein